MKIMRTHKYLNFAVDLTDGEENYIKILELNPAFEKYIKICRKELNIPENGIDISTNTIDGRTVNQINIKMLVSKITYLVIHIYKLPMSWMNTFLYITMFNVAAPPDKDSFPPLEIKVIDGKPHLILNENIPTSQIKKFLSENKTKVDELRKELPKHPKSRMSTIDKKKPIYNKRNIIKNGKKTKFREISEELQNGYGDKYTDEIALSVYFQRLEKQITKQLKDAKNPLMTTSSILQKI